MSARHLAVAVSSVVLALLALAAMARPQRTAATDAPPRPNILILVADDMSWRDLELVPTPNIDRLAAAGITFTSMYANPVCTPTRITCLWGIYSYRAQIGTIVHAQGTTGLTDEQNPPMGFERLSLAELLKAAGYATLAAGKNHLANGVGGLQAEAMRIHGFDHNLASSQFTLPSDYFNWWRVDDGEAKSCTDYNTTEIARTISDWWNTTEGPRFCWGAFNAPHLPFHVPPASTLPPGFVVGESDRARYEAAIMAMDHEIGNVLESVDLDDTIVVFLTDNGTPGSVPAPGVNPKRIKGTVFDGGVRVPFIMAGPGFSQGATRDALANTTDLYATLAERLGLSIPAGEALDSVSMLPYLLHADAPPQRDWVYSEHWAPNGPGPKTLVGLMARNRTHKLMDLDSDGTGPLPHVEALFRMEAETFIKPTGYTDADRAALAELKAVLADKGPPR